MAITRPVTSIRNGVPKDATTCYSVLPELPKAVAPDAIVLGVIGSPRSHDSSAALVAGDKVIAAVEEERFVGIKHVGAYPFHSIDYCLRKAGLSFSDVDYVVYPFLPNRFVDVVVNEPLRLGEVAPGALTARRGLVDAIEGIIPALEQHYQCSVRDRFFWMNHHLAHGSSAYFVSGFDRAVVLSVDGGGDRECGSLMYGDETGLRLVHSYLDYPQSLGRFYDIVTRFLIENPTHRSPRDAGRAIVWDAGKLMGLAGYGTPDPSFFEGLVSIDDDEDYPVTFDMSYFSVHTGEYPFSKKWVERFGPPRAPGESFKPSHFVMAASAQLVLEQAMLALAKSARKKFPECRSLCLAGGTALNVLANRRIRDEAGFDNIFIAPASNDAGTALGAALYVHSAVSNCRNYQYSVYSGPDIGEDFATRAELEAFGEKISFIELELPDLCAQVVNLLVDNKIIGWAQGRMEFGPRALGSRSFLTNAANPLAKEMLNSKVKKREHYRPYAPSILAEESSNWFDVEDSPHMLLSAIVREDKRQMVPGIVHYDYTTRPQTVTADDNPAYHALLSAFFKRTGIPLLLNTSLNAHGGTIVNSPSDAVELLLSTEMDALVVGRFFVLKRSAGEK